jgi:hypothetical protein
MMLLLMHRLCSQRGVSGQVLQLRVLVMRKSDSCSCCCAACYQHVCGASSAHVTSASIVHAALQVQFIDNCDAATGLVATASASRKHVMQQV